MPMFKRSLSQKGRKSKADDDEVDSSAQSFLGLNLPDEQSLGSLVGPDSFVQLDPPPTSSTVPDGFAKEGEAISPTASSAATDDGGRVGRSSRSSSQGGTLPYHRPWNRNLTPLEGETGGQEVTTSTHSQGSPLSKGAAASAASPTKKKTGKLLPSHSPHLAMAVASASGSAPAPAPAGLGNFRTSPSAELRLAQPTAAERRSVMDSARQISLRRSKAPTQFNILVVGGRMTGKTSWIRTLLSTFDLGLCNEETKVAASHFGIASSSGHVSRETDPITPLPTKGFNVLNGVELHPHSFLALAALEQGEDESMAPGRQTHGRPSSVFSSPQSLFTSGSKSASGKIQLSVCDTPGFDFEVEDEFEIDRKASDVIKYVEEKLVRTLTEEGKVQRTNRTDTHIHLVLYFIDPRLLVERSASRREEKKQSRYGARSISESQLAGRNGEAGGMPTRSVSTPMMEEARREEGDGGDGCAVEGLSNADVSILARLSRMTNVLPIIAKADTLTTARMQEVRQAVRKSLRAAKIDLGTFDIGAARTSRKKKLSLRRMDGDNAADEEQQEQMTEAEVKLIRIRKRRSFSNTIDRPMSTGEPEEGGGQVHYTDPLFAHDEEEDDDGPSNEELMKKVPLSIFVPEPVRTTSKRRKPSLSSAARRPSSADDEVSSLQGGHVPPVPPLPRDLSSRDTSSDAQESSVGGEPREQLISSPTSSSQAPAPTMPAALPPSRRFERTFRWGSAHVLDPDQCDFGLLRSTIMGTHLEALKASTAERYEEFRTHRLELNRLLRQGRPEQ